MQPDPGRIHPAVLARALAFASQQGAVTNAGQAVRPLGILTVTWPGVSLGWRISGPAWVTGDGGPAGRATS